MKRVFQTVLLLTAVVFAFCMGTGTAEGTEIQLPDKVHFLKIPENALFQAPDPDETDLKGIYLLPPDLEMEIFAYEMQEVTVWSLAEALTNAGQDAQVREIAGMEFLVFRDMDEADGANCIGYGYIQDGQMIEISFFYATQDAMDLTKIIMESFHS